MSESEFLEQVEAVMGRIETLADHLAATLDEDIETTRSGNVMTLETDTGKVIINSQSPLQEIWLAAKTGGFHYRYDGMAWRNTRDQSELFTALEQLLRDQVG